MGVDHKIIIACAEVGWEFECPKRWDELTRTSEKAVRYCETCQQQVHLCTDINQVNRRARLGQCIAWVKKAGSEEIVATIGLPSGPYSSIGEQGE